MIAMDVAARTSAAGRRLGRYTLLARIAQGGMAEVHLGRAIGPSGFEKLVALKLVLSHLADEPQFIAMFLDEARLAAKLTHVNIAQVIDLDRVEGQPFIVMEYVHGRDLRATLRAAATRGGLGLAAALTILRDACAGLHHAHELRGDDGRPLGLVHRDVSPQNLMVRYDGTTKLVDFGIAKASSHVAVTRTGVLKGKLGYFSPEQCLGRALDRRSDVYALGIVAYEATTCMRLFHGDNEAAVLNRVIEGDFEQPSEIDPDYPPALEQLVLRALARDPNDRFATAAELQEAIEDVARELGLRLGESVVAERMHALFGDVPYPRREPERTVVAATSPIPRNRPTRPLAIAATLSVLVATTSWWVASGDHEDAGDDTPGTRVPPPIAMPVPLVRAPSTSLVATEAPPVVASPVPEPVPALAPKRGKPRAGKRSDPRPDKPAPGDSPDSMMPRG